VDLVISGAGLFFLVSGADASEKDAAPRGAEPEYSFRFPAFGPFDASRVGDATLGLLREALARSHAEAASDDGVRRMLEKMVVIIPRKRTDELLIHDIWGHWWQGVLLDFGTCFSEWERIRAKPVGPELLSAGAFQGDDARTTLRAELARSLVRADLGARLRAGLGAVLSEALADLLEFKYQLWRPALPTTSLLRPSPLRLDLSLRDVREVAATSRLPYQGLCGSAGAREELGRTLRGAGYPARGSDAAVRDLAALVEEETSLALGEDRSARSPGALRLGATQRTMLNLACLEMELENALQPRAGSQGRGAPLSEACATSVDLLAICLGCAYEFDREAGFWQAPQLVASVIPRFVRSLATELEAQEPSRRDEHA
jgi:hypothetical protein